MNFTSSSVLIPANKQIFTNSFDYMYWTIELAATLEDAPWPATRDELIEWAERNGCPQQVLDNLYELDEEDDTPYESIEEIWPDYIMKEDFFHNEEDEGFDYDDV